MATEELVKKYPNLKEFFPFLDLLQKESDRGQVLISTGFLEQQLKDVLLAFMRDTPESQELFAGANAPLGSFSSRITACFSLGLITEPEHHDLHLLRKIRNSFAHHIHTSFETQSVIDRCALLKHKAHDYVNEQEQKVEVQPSGQFTTAAVGLILSLVNRAHYVAKERREKPNWPQ